MIALSSGVFAQEDAPVYFSAEQLTVFQKEPEWLERTLEQFLKTLIEQPELLVSEETVDALGTRIYMKLRLLNDPAEKGQAWMAILGENTEETLRQLALEETRFSWYRPVYPLMDFLVKDFRKTLYPFDFQKLVPYFLISQFDGFEAFFSLTNEEHYHIAKGVLNGIVNNQTYPEHSLKAMVKLLDEKYLRAYASFVQPMISAKSEVDYTQELRLAKSYVDQAGYLYGEELSQKAEPKLYQAFLSLSQYFSCREDALIVENRVALASQDTYLSLLPVVLELIDRYEQITINKELLENALVSLIRNYGLKTRLFGPEITEEIQRKWKSYTDAHDLSPMILKTISSDILEGGNTVPVTFPTPATPTETVSWIKRFQWRHALVIALPILSLLLLMALLPASLKAKVAKAFGRKEKALALFQKASFSKPEVAEYHVQMAILLGLLHREEEAIQEYRIATKILSMSENNPGSTRRRSSR